MTKRAGRPYAETPLAAFLEKRILELKPRKTQLEIVIEAGFVQPNMLSMFKNGSNKVPLDRVPGQAKALECDPTLLFKLALEQLGSDTTGTAIEQIFGTIVTRNEVAWLEEIRKASDRSDPSITMKARAAIRGDLREMISSGKNHTLHDWRKCELTENERAWIEFIKLCSLGRDPAPTLRRVQDLTLLFFARSKGGGKCCIDLNSVRSVCPSRYRAITFEGAAKHH